MLASKIYTLPVFDKEGVIKGVIQGKDIWQKVLSDEALLKHVSENIEIHEPLSEGIDVSVKDVFHRFKEKSISRMILVNSEGALAGIVTRGDIMKSKMKPSSRKKFSTEITQGAHSSLAAEKKYRKDETVRNYYTSLVDTLDVDTDKAEIVKHLVTSAHNSVVLVDNDRRPTGFLSTRDILQALVLLKPKKDIPLSIRRPSDSVSDKELERAVDHLRVFGKKMKKRMEIEKIEISTGEVKSPEGRTNFYNITLVLTPISGNSITATIKHRKFIDGVQEATKLIEKQYRRSDK